MDLPHYSNESMEKLESTEVAEQVVTLELRRIVLEPGLPERVRIIPIGPERPDAYHGYQVLEEDVVDETERAFPKSEWRPAYRRRA